MRVGENVWGRFSSFHKVTNSTCANDRCGGDNFIDEKTRKKHGNDSKTRKIHGDSRNVWQIYDTTSCQLYLRMLLKQWLAAALTALFLTSIPSSWLVRYDPEFYIFQILIGSSLLATVSTVLVEKILLFPLLDVLRSWRRFPVVPSVTSKVWSRNTNRALNRSDKRRQILSKYFWREKVKKEQICGYLVVSTNVSTSVEHLRRLRERYTEHHQLSQLQRKKNFVSHDTGRENTTIT